MTTVDRYITAHALKTTLFVVLALVLLISLFNLFEELEEDRGTYGFIEAVTYIFQTLPRRTDEILVYGIFLGYLITLGRLAENNEVTIFRVSGMSPMRIMGALMPSMLIWLIVSIGLAEFLAPASERVAQVQRLKHLYGDDALNNRGGLWLRVDRLYMQVRAIDETGKIHGVSQYWLDDDKTLVETIQAETGTYDADAGQWNLVNGTRTILDEEGARMEPFRARTWEYDITPELLAAQAFLEANKMSLLDLNRQIDFARSQHIGVNEYELTFWSRILKPLTYFGLALFALAVVLGPLREVGMGVRITFGIFAGLGFKYLQDLFAPAAIVFSIPALLAILIPIGVYWGVAIHLLKRNA